MDDLDSVLQVIDSLNREGVEYVVIGEVALNLHGVVRATQDLDIFLAATRDNVEKLRQALRRVWDDPDIDLITADDLCGEYPSVRYGPPQGHLYLDILTRLGELAKYHDVEVETRTVQGIEIRTATVKSLIWLKSNTVRAIDKADAAALKCLYNIGE